MPTLTKELESRFDALKQRGRLPRKDSLAKSLKCSVEDANDLLNQWRAKHGERVRGEVMVKEVEPTRPEPWYKGISPAFDWVIDKGTVLIAVVLSLVLCAFSLWIMGPSDFEKVGFVALAFVIVLFGFRALLKGNFWLWVRCELIAGFLGVSFVLVGLDYQTNLTADDRQLTALETAESTALEYLTTLQGLQASKGEGYKSQVEAQQVVYTEAQTKASAYRVEVANKPKKAPEIKAYDILLAIPKAVMGSSAKLSNDLAMLIALGLFTMVFWILPETLWTTVMPSKKEKTGL